MPAPDDLALIEQAARDAGEIARAFYGGTYRQWDKSKGQPVTEADIAVNQFLHDRLTGARPDYGWLSEESADNAERLTRAKTFVIDPIDGTIAFIRGKPDFTISIAVVAEGRPVDGVVFNPITLDCFSASEGKGTTLNGAPVQASACDAVADCRMLAAKSMFGHPGWTVPPLTPWPAMRIEQRNSIAYRLALVASGQFDATLALARKQDWDLAAGDLIVREAGGIVSDHLGSDLVYNRAVPSQRSLIAAGPRLHKLVLDRVHALTLPEA